VPQPSYRLREYVAAAEEVAEAASINSLAPAQARPLATYFRGILSVLPGTWMTLLAKLEKLFHTDEWYLSRLSSLSSTPTILEDGTTRVVVDGKVYTYRFRPIDVLEMMVVDRIARDPEARRLFVRDVVEAVGDVLVRDGERYVTLREYVESRGMKWEEVAKRLGALVERYAQRYLRMMERYDRGMVQGDRLAYYLYIRSTVDDRAAAFTSYVAEVVGFTLLSSIVARSVFARLMPERHRYTRLRAYLTEGEVAASFMKGLLDAARGRADSTRVAEEARKLLAHMFARDFSALAPHTHRRIAARVQRMAEQMAR